MSLTDDQVNHIINDQEETISSLKDNLLAMEDLRDLEVGKGLELVKTLKRIVCATEQYDAPDIHFWAKQAIDAYQAK